MKEGEKRHTSCYTTFYVLQNTSYINLQYVTINSVLYLIVSLSSSFRLLSLSCQLFLCKANRTQQHEQHESNAEKKNERSQDAPRWSILPARIPHRFTMEPDTPPTLQPDPPTHFTTQQTHFKTQPETESQDSRDLAPARDSYAREDVGGSGLFGLKYISSL